MMKLARPVLPAGIDADLAITVATEQVASIAREQHAFLSASYAYKGQHERTAKGDDVQLSLQTRSGRIALKYALKRDSLYHILPEYLFHPLDRYADCDGDREKFQQCRKEQKRVEADALSYFYPFDKTFQELRTRFQSRLNNRILRDNLFVADLITEGNNFNRNNRFIANVYPCIVWLRAYRGVARMIEMALRMAFHNELIGYEVTVHEAVCSIDPTACHYSLDGQLDDLFCGNTYAELVTTIRVVYQTPIVSQKQIALLHRDVDEFTAFFQTWFLGLNQRLEVCFGDYTKKPVLRVGTTDNDLYLGYNTQLLE